MKTFIEFEIYEHTKKNKYFICSSNFWDKSDKTTNRHALDYS